MPNQTAIRRFQKLIAAVTCSSFLFSFVCAGAVEGAAEFARDTRLSSNLRVSAASPSSLPLPEIPAAAGRITGARDFGSPLLVINIQDLHCHAEVQRNIAHILSSLDAAYKLSKVFVEGGYGTIDTAWLDGIRDDADRRKIVEDLVDRGRLSGGEYYSMIAGRRDLLSGLEDEKLHKANIVRLGKVLERQPAYGRTLKEMTRELEYLKARHLSAENKRLNRVLARYRSGGMDERQYYALLMKCVEKIHARPQDYHNLLSLSIDRYPNIKAQAGLAEARKQLRYRQASKELQACVRMLKSKLPYAAYRQLMEETGNLSRTGVLCARLDSLARDYPLGIRENYPELYKLLACERAAGAVNPVSLVSEEKRLVEELRAAFSRDIAEVEVSFLADFFDSFADYLTNRLSAEDHDYFTARFEKFKAVWAKYAVRDRVGELTQDFPLLDEFYAVNVRRNGVFVENLFAQPAASGAAAGPQGRVCVTVSGGFHAAGLAKLLDERKISHVTITPRVTTGVRASGSIYQELARAQSRLFSSQALSLTLAACGAKLLSMDGSRAEILINGDPLVYRRSGSGWKLQRAPAAAAARDYDEITRAVGEAAAMAATVAPGRIGYTADIINRLAGALGQWGTVRGLWGADGLIWAIAVNDEVRAALGDDLEKIARLPELLQYEALFTAQKKLDLRRLPPELAALAPILEMEGMYAAWSAVRTLAAEQTLQKELDEACENDAERTAAEAIVRETGAKGIVTVDVWERDLERVPALTDEIVNGINGGRVIVLRRAKNPATGMRKPLGLTDNDRFYHFYGETVMEVFLAVSQRLDHLLRNRFLYRTVPGKSGRDIWYFLNETMKNALVHSNGGIIDAPIYLFMADRRLLVYSIEDNAPENYVIGTSVIGNREIVFDAERFRKAAGPADLGMFGYGLGHLTMGTKEDIEKLEAISRETRRDVEVEEKHEHTRILFERSPHVPAGGGVHLYKNSVTYTPVNGPGVTGSLFGSFDWKPLIETLSARAGLTGREGDSARAALRRAAGIADLASGGLLTLTFEITEAILDGLDLRRDTLPEAGAVIDRLGIRGFIAPENVHEVRGPPEAVEGLAAHNLVTWLADSTGVLHVYIHESVMAEWRAQEQENPGCAAAFCGAVLLHELYEYIGYAHDSSLVSTVRIETVRQLFERMSAEMVLEYLERSAAGLLSRQPLATELVEPPHFEKLAWRPAWLDDAARAEITRHFPQLLDAASIMGQLRMELGNESLRLHRVVTDPVDRVEFKALCSALPDCTRDTNGTVYGRGFAARSGRVSSDYTDLPAINFAFRGAACALSGHEARITALIRSYAANRLAGLAARGVSAHEVEQLLFDLLCAAYGIDAVVVPGSAIIKNPAAVSDISAPNAEAYFRKKDTWRHTAPLFPAEGDKAIAPASPERLLAAPAGELLKTLGFLETQGPAAARLVRERQYNGALVRTVSVPARQNAAAIPAGAEILQNELGPYTSFDILYNKRGEPIAVFPAYSGPVSPETIDPYRGALYLDLSDYYADLVQPGNFRFLEAWYRNLSAADSNRQLIERYKRTFVDTRHAALLRLDHDVRKAPYMFIFADTERGAWYAIELDDKVLGTIEGAGGGAVLPVYPTVFSSGNHGNYVLDRDYYQALLREGTIKPGDKVLVVGPGPGSDTIVAGTLSREPVTVAGINPLEIANTIHNTRVCGIQVNANVRDNIIDPNGRPAFDEKFDVIIWNMPDFTPAGDSPAAAMQYVGELKQYWDGDPNGRTYRRFMEGVKQLLKPEGKVLIWNRSLPREALRMVPGVRVEPLGDYQSVYRAALDPDAEAFIAWKDLRKILAGAPLAAAAALITAFNIPALSSLAAAAAVFAGVNAVTAAGKRLKLLSAGRTAITVDEELSSANIFARAHGLLHRLLEPYDGERDSAKWHRRLGRLLGGQEIFVHLFDFIMLVPAALQVAGSSRAPQPPSASGIFAVPYKAARDSGRHSALFAASGRVKGDIVAALSEHVAGTAFHTSGGDVNLDNAYQDALITETIRNAVDAVFLRIDRGQLKETDGRIEWELTAGRSGEFSLRISDNGTGIQQTIIRGWEKGYFRTNKTDDHTETIIGGMGQGFELACVMTGKLGWTMSVATRAQSEPSAYIRIKNRDRMFFAPGDRKAPGTDVTLTNGRHSAGLSAKAAEKESGKKPAATTAAAHGATAGIDWVITDDLKALLGEYGDYDGVVTTDGGDLACRAYAVNRRPDSWGQDRTDIVNFGRTESGRDVWGAIESGAAVFYSDVNDPLEIARAVTLRLRRVNDVAGDGILAGQLKGLFSRPVRNPEIRKALAGAEFDGIGIFVRYAGENEAERYSCDAEGNVSVLLQAGLAEDKAGDRLGAVRANRRGHAAAMASSMPLYLDREVVPLANVEALVRLNGRQIIVDGMERALAVQQKLDGIRQKFETGIRVYALVEKDSDLERCKALGLSGCYAAASGRFYDTACSEEGIPAEIIEGKNADEIRRNLRRSTAACRIVRVSDVAGALKEGRDLLDLLGLTGLFGPGVMEFFGKPVYNERYVRDAVYGFDADEFDRPRTAEVFLGTMREQLGESTQYEALKAVFENAVNGRRLAEEYISRRGYVAEMPAHHKQMLGTALALKERADGEGRPVSFEKFDMSEAGINRAFQALKSADKPRPQSVDEFIAMVELFDSLLIDAEKMSLPDTDLRSIAAILQSA